MKQLKSWSKSLSAVHIWNIYILSHVLNIMYKPCFLLYIVLCFLQCMIKVASCVILLPFHVFPCPPALIMVLNIHHINLNLYDIPLIIFLFFLLAVCWFLLAVFQHFWRSQNFAFSCLDTFSNLSNLPSWCYEKVAEQYGYHQCLLQTLSQAIIFIFFHTRFMSLFTFTKFQ